MNRILSIAALLFFGASGAAHAATLDITLGSAANSFASFGTGGALSPNINLTAAIPTILTLTGTADLQTTSLANQYAKPDGILFGGNYLAVRANPPSGTATFTLSPGENVFAFTWGTIDNYNSLLLTDSRSVTYSLTGQTILNALADLALPHVDGTTQSDVSFYDPFGRIVSAQLTSSINAFEVANFSQSAVPLPAALPLFGAALLGLLFFARQRSRVRV